ncbi:MAG: hypothetical protein ACE5MI_09660 [Acidimicrobiia bacterium]
MGVVLIPLGLVGFIVGIVGLTRPIRPLGITSRQSTAAFVGGGFALMLVGAVIGLP